MGNPFFVKIDSEPLVNISFHSDERLCLVKFFTDMRTWLCLEFNMLHFVNQAVDKLLTYPCYSHQRAVYINP